MTAPKTKYPIESFGPELLAALKRGGRERFVIPFPGPEGLGKKKAHNFQRRIHTLRQRMRQLNHPDYMIASRAKVSIFWGERAVEQGGPKEWFEDDQGLRGALIVIAPHDSEFTDALTAAGVTVSTSPTSPVAVRERDDLDNLLDELAKPGAPT